MKYGEDRIVEAIYDSDGIKKGNPFLEAMPEMLTREELFEQIKGVPVLPSDVNMRMPMERRNMVPMLSEFFMPMDYMYRLYDCAYRAMKQTYMTMTTKNSIAQLNAMFACFNGDGPRLNFAMQCECGAILGVPGIGKTSSFKRCMATMPQVIAHTSYFGEPFFCKQITYLFTECPSDCSIKALAWNIANAIDNAIGSNYVLQITNTKMASTGAAALFVKQLCINHHVGVLIIDEIQNVILTARRAHQTSRLIKFLVELMNDTATSIYLIGTMEAEEMFLQEEHLKRRTRGARLLPMKYDAIFRHFLETLWSIQFTREKSPLTEKISGLLFDYSGGIPAYIIKIYQEAQIQAILSNEECITEPLIRNTIKLMALEPPKVYTNGMSISDFSIAEEALDEITIIKNKRGRKAERRDELDILELAKCCPSEQGLIEQLQSHGMLEDCRC